MIFHDEACGLSYAHAQCEHQAEHAAHHSQVFLGKIPASASLVVVVGHVDVGSYGHHCGVEGVGKVDDHRLECVRGVQVVVVVVEVAHYPFDAFDFDHSEVVVAAAQNDGHDPYDVALVEQVFVADPYSHLDSACCHVVADLGQYLLSLTC
jgi:hypothetical protein